MTIQPSLWLLRLMLVCCLQYNIEGSRYDRCSTREGRSGICVAKRYCREATTSPRQVLTACSNGSGFYCCPVPTQRSAAGAGSSDHEPPTAPPVRPISSFVKPSTHRTNSPRPTPSHISSPPSTASHEETYRYPERNKDSTGTRLKQTENSGGSGSERFQGDVRFDDGDRPPTRRPIRYEQDRPHVSSVTTRPPVGQRQTSSPTRSRHDEQDREYVPSRPRPNEQRPTSSPARPRHDEQDREYVPSRPRPNEQRPAPSPRHDEQDRQHVPSVTARPPVVQRPTSSPTRRPRHDEQERQYVPSVTTRRSVVQRPTPPPSRNNNRSAPEKHILPADPIKFPEEYKPPHPPAPACGQKPYEFFIAGGEESKQHEWPWMVAIFRRHTSPKPNTYICGGSLINSRYVLTAAHCFIHNYVILPASTFVVRLGAHYLDSGEDYTVANLVLHHNHSGSEFFNDIALIRLASEVYFTDKIAPICLPSHEMRFNAFVDRMATVAGWGATAFYRTADSRVLQHVTLPVLSNEECSSAYSRVRGAAFLARGTDHIICAGLREGGKDACLGDSGGPLMLKTTGDSWTVIGIVSLGYKCAEPGYPGVYTRVTHYLDWIYSNMKNS